MSKMGLHHALQIFDFNHTAENAVTCSFRFIMRCATIELQQLMRRHPLYGFSLRPEATSVGSLSRHA